MIPIIKEAMHMTFSDSLAFKMLDYFSGMPKQAQHLLKVRDFALLIAHAEGLDAATCERIEIAALVHDIGIRPSLSKYGSSAGHYQELEGPSEARTMLDGCPTALVDRVCYLVGHHHTYDAIDGDDYQVLVEADFLVNFFEDDCSADAIRAACGKIFRTETGKRLCQTMFAL